MQNKRACPKAHTHTHTHTLTAAKSEKVHTHTHTENLGIPLIRSSGWQIYAAF